MCDGIADAILRFVLDKSLCLVADAPFLPEDLKVLFDAYFVPFDPYPDIAIGMDYALLNRKAGGRL